MLVQFFCSQAWRPSLPLGPERPFGIYEDPSTKVDESHLSLVFTYVRNLTSVSMK